MKYAIVGAAGIQARGILLDLIEFDTDPELLLLDVDQAALDARLALFEGANATAEVFDVLDHDRSVAQLRGCDVFIMAGPSRFFGEALDIAIAARCDYVDMGSDYQTSRQQMARAEAASEAGITALLSAGSAPGLSNMMAKAAIDRLDTVSAIDITVAMTDVTDRSDPFHWPFALEAIIDEYTLPAGRIVGGEEVDVPPRTGEWVEFPDPIGRVFPIFTTHPEQYTLYDSYRDRGLRHTSFRIALPEDFHRKMAFLADIGLAGRNPVRVGNVEVVPKDVLQAVTRGLPRSVDTERQFSATRVEVEGLRDGSVRRMVVDMWTGSHEEWNVPAGMLKTCVPPSIIAQMIAHGAVREAGVWMPEHIVPTRPFFTELAARGMDVTIDEQELLRGAR
ncbi:saccharopine dehydrogenase C-terminal domain-containing protein [Microbacterium sp. Mu-80]|uniref:Saccharopine dehydrogenase C-terminal domain-containing protein n=1 Tax=Microbacterium bandirmense TaxID=3122050 RepID=A0ABU8LF68_9MICO